ncbi:glycosyltransferase family 4 protein [Devosia sp. Root413D1]|uniref:glycosyltransferase family 4 protein n=1 Tax=Devosia sp. Root413D1 TaxID=1736531 RepID=UPI0009EBC1D8|nr:glycosyltransferase family 4 protein [Devosia sp. Root413D1]
MRVVMVGPYPEPGDAITGGVERVIDTLLPELSRHLDLTLVVPGASRDLETKAHGVPVVYLQRGPGTGALRYWTSDAARLKRAVDRFRPELVHLQGSAGVGRKLRTKRVLTIHGFAHRDILVSARGQRWGSTTRRLASRLVECVEADARARSKNIILINPYVRDVLPDVATAKTFDIPNALDPVFCALTSMASERQRNSIVSIGRVGPLKNTLGMLRIAARVMNEYPSATLRICGSTIDDAYYQACRTFANSEGIGDRVHWLGNVSAADLASTLDTASCLLVNSLQENAPMAIAEANARGVPAVSAKKFGMQYMITPGENGFFFLDDDINDQTSVLQAALLHDWDRSRISREARHKYDLKQIVEQTVSAYQQIIAT